MPSKTLKDILAEDSITLMRSGNRWVASCPFHEGDRDPSFTIYEETGTYYCFGCEAWGDAVKFLTDYRHFTYPQALEYVGADYKLAQKKNRVIKIRDTLSTWKFLAEVTDTYHKFLYSMPGAISYLNKRGLSDKTIEKYKLGYTDGRVLSISNVEDFKLAQEIGLLTDRGSETLSHRVIIPNILDKDEVDFLTGRTVVNDRVKYLNLRMPKPIFGFHEVRQSPVIFIAEGQFDWLVLRQWDYPAAVIGGTHLPYYQQQILSDKTLVIIPDQDDVGLKAASKLKERFDKAYILDMASLGVKDVAELAPYNDGRQVFDKLVKEQLAWFNTLLSKTTLMKWLPTLVDSTFSLSI